MATNTSPTGCDVRTVCPRCDRCGKRHAPYIDTEWVRVPPGAIGRVIKVNLPGPQGPCITCQNDDRKKKRDDENKQRRKDRDERGRARNEAEEKRQKEREAETYKRKTPRKTQIDVAEVKG
jgi:hypothetical protein